MFADPGGLFGEPDGVLGDSGVLITGVGVQALLAREKDVSHSPHWLAAEVHFLQLSTVHGLSRK